MSDFLFRCNKQKTQARTLCYLSSHCSDNTTIFFSHQHYYCKMPSFPIETSLHILLKIGGAISCISSFLLARHILKKKWADMSLSSMMLLGISVMDVIGSFFGYVMGLWMSGEGIYYIQSGPLIAGDTQTCTAQGFILTFAFTYFLTAYAGLGALCELWFNSCILLIHEINIYKCLTICQFLFSYKII